jgi:hypothetical protein
MTKYFLSPSALNLFGNCRRCFWMDRKMKIKRPRGIFPSLPGGMDRVIKPYFDSFRTDRLLPPELRVKGFQDVKLFDDQSKLDLWREWRTGLRYEENGSVLSGALDDLMVKGDKFIPLDYKTKGSPTTAAQAARYYSNQMNCYALMLEANLMPAAGYAFLIYYSPSTVGEKGQVSFNVQAMKIEASTQKARDTFLEAIQCLNGPEPVAADECEYCVWLQRAVASPAR